MDYKVVYTRRSQKELAALNQDAVRRILLKMLELTQLEDPMLKAKKLKGFKMPTFRFRIGEYRVVFRQDKASGKLVILVVLRIVHRKDAYSR